MASPSDRSDSPGEVSMSSSSIPAWACAMSWAGPSEAAPIVTREVSGPAARESSGCPGNRELSGSCRVVAIETNVIVSRALFPLEAASFRKGRCKIPPSELTSATAGKGLTNQFTKLDSSCCLCYFHGHGTEAKGDFNL